MIFREDAIKHMEKYKQNALYMPDKARSYTESYKGKVKKHILPEPKWNLLETNLQYFEEIERDLSDLLEDKHFLHMNSSLAMTLNFFFPIIKREKIDSVLKALRIEKPADPTQKVQFEYKSSIEGKETRTSIDVYIPLTGGEKVYIEVKFSEDKFGSYGDKKWPNFRKKYYDAAKLVFPGKIDNEDPKTRKWCFDNYQVIRNVIHILGEDMVIDLQNNKDPHIDLDQLNYCVFLYPYHNEPLHKKSTEMPSLIANDRFRSHVIFKTWEDLLDDLIPEMILDPELRKIEKEFREKYFFWE